ncbi:MAG: ABC transporter ATP-binding protein [Antricoccus sp.]
MSAPKADGAKAPARTDVPGGRQGGPAWMAAAQANEKSANFGPSAKRLVARLRPERLMVITVLIAAMVGVSLTVLGPKIIGHATDIIFAGFIGRNLGGASVSQAIAGARASGNTSLADLLGNLAIAPTASMDFSALGMTLLLALAAYTFGSVFSWVQGYLLNGVVQRTVFRMREDVETKLNKLPLSYFDKQPRGEILSRVTNDIDNVSQTLQQTMSQLLNSLLTVIGVVLMMLIISPLLALIALITIPLSMFVTKTIAKRSQKQFVAQWRNTGILNAHIEEAFTGHELVKVFGRQREVEAAFAAKNDELYSASFGAQFMSGVIMPSMMFIGNLNYVAIAVVGGIRVATGAMSLGDVQAFIQYSRQFTQPLTQVASMANLLQSGVASAERVFELLDAQEQVPDVPQVAAPAKQQGRVAFENVSFSYDPETVLISNLSLVAEPGQTIAIVGPTGAGKTTLVNLLMRFYEISSGAITLDGVDIREIPRAQLRSRTGMVLQDTWLFGGSIRDNIAYGKEGATDAEIIAAARATYVDRFVSSLPDGYATLISEEGDNVSAGEKQLITIARAFLSSPSVLILDEATSSVDTRTELLVQHAMAALRTDRTSFVIAHRLSTIRDADVILVMEAGQIVEKGTHMQLLAAHGPYFNLYNAQFTAPAVEEESSAQARPRS